MRDFVTIYLVYLCNKWTPYGVAFRKHFWSQSTIWFVSKSPVYCRKFCFWYSTDVSLICRAIS